VADGVIILDFDDIPCCVRELECCELAMLCTQPAGKMAVLSIVGMGSVCSR